MDTSQYLDIFIDETKEHLQSLNEHVLVLEKEPDNEDTINEIFRAAHSLKGMAGTMGYKNMQLLAHHLENVFSEIRNGKVKVRSKLVDILFRGLDALEDYLSRIQGEGNEGTRTNQDIIDDLELYLEGDDSVTEEKPKKKSSKKEPAKEAVKKPASESAAPNEKFKANQITMTDHELMGIRGSSEEGKNIYAITVYLQKSCILKAARAFLVFKGLEDKGEVIKSVPSIEEIEDEEFEFDFSWIFITDESKEEIKKIICNVSEIDEVYIEDYIGEDESDSEPVEDEDIEEDSQEETVYPDSSEENLVVAEQQAQPAKSGKAAVNRSVRVDIDKLDTLMNLVSELIIAKNGLVSVSSVSQDENSNEPEQGKNGFNEQIEYLERVTTNLHESVMKVRMVPIESVVNRFPRMIRDLNRKLGKKMELYMTGEETELDRTVIDEIGDPLMHLLRNSADHGLESNQERIKIGKPEIGSIFLDAYQEGNNVTIEVRDDGGGIDLQRVKKKAMERGALTEKQAETITDSELLELLFLPSFSTAEKVSDVSGRGVGLDVVKTKIEALGGSVDAKTELGVGSTFSIQLPLTLAIIQALMVEVGIEKYAIPLGNINTIEDISPDEIKFVQNKEVIHLRGTVIPIVRLTEVLDTDPQEKDPSNLIVVVVKKGNQYVGLVIDKLLGQQETVIKSLDHHITNEKLFSGATILGDGEVALILDTNTLI
ncbi:MAG: chemotaxis protein CheA [Lachnoclostridium sp.]|jgi:two-component system chemotaxis sensor kinase CheA|nr:chemotaxis protein CheA [Lachnoclostridium sp.]